MEEAGTPVNASELLPGHRGGDIPSPDRVEICELRDHFFAPQFVARGAADD